MLWTPGCEFGWSVDNFGATYTDAGIGLNSPGHANANTKGANTSMLVGIAEDCYGIAIGFSGGNTTNVARRNLVDLLIDPAAGVGNAGSSWSVIIANLYCAMASLGQGGYWYYFPLYLKAGTAIGTANQSSTASTSALRVFIQVFGKPSRPDLVKVGSKVQTIGADTTTTAGSTTMTLGLNAMGALTASLGSTSSDLWWWQGGLGFGSAGVNNASILFDLLAGDGTNNLLCQENIQMVVRNSEEMGKGVMGSRYPYRFIPSGTNVYMRGLETLDNASEPTVVAYGLGG